MINAGLMSDVAYSAETVEKLWSPGQMDGILEEFLIIVFGLLVLARTLRQCSSAEEVSH